MNYSEVIEQAQERVAELRDQLTAYATRYAGAIEQDEQVLLVLEEDMGQVSAAIAAAEDGKPVGVVLDALHTATEALRRLVVKAAEIDREHDIQVRLSATISGAVASVRASITEVADLVRRKAEEGVAAAAATRKAVEDRVGEVHDQVAAGVASTRKAVEDRVGEVHGQVTAGISATREAVEDRVAATRKSFGATGQQLTGMLERLDRQMAESHAASLPAEEAREQGRQAIEDVVRAANELTEGVAGVRVLDAARDGVLEATGRVSEALCRLRDVPAHEVPAAAIGEALGGLKRASSALVEAAAANKAALSERAQAAVASSSQRVQRLAAQAEDAAVAQAAALDSRLGVVDRVRAIDERFGVSARALRLKEDAEARLGPFDELWGQVEKADRTYCTGGCATRSASGAARFATDVISGLYNKFLAAREEQQTAEPKA